MYIYVCMCKDKDITKLVKSVVSNRAYWNFRGSLSTRIIGGILVEVVVFVTTIILAMIDSSEWPGVFFWATMASVIVLNSKSGGEFNKYYYIK